MKVVTVVGARPQFVKAAVVGRCLRKKHREVLVHTGQHYDPALSQVFFDELQIPPPDYNLEVGSLPHGAQTGAILATIEPVLLEEKPDWVIVYGDTNSTLAGALAAAKLRVKVAHVEAGLRSFNRDMPEEINRIVTDHLADLLLCPSVKAMENVEREGLGDRAVLVGDVMAQALEFAVRHATTRSGVLERLNVRPHQFVLATVHRAENTDDAGRLVSIVNGFGKIAGSVVFPIHPRTRHALQAQGLSLPPNVMGVDPLGYLDMVCVASAARMIVTDSGGVQKEAYWLGVPCVTLRDETEWVETVTHGWNVLVGVDADRIAWAARAFQPPRDRPPLYVGGAGMDEVIQLLERACPERT